MDLLAAQRSLGCSPFCFKGSSEPAATAANPSEWARTTRLLVTPPKRTAVPGRPPLRRFIICAIPTQHTNAGVQNVDLPVPPPKHGKKPFVRPPRRGGFLTKKWENNTRERILRPPANGMALKKFIPLAQRVFQARNTVIELVGKLMEVVPVKVCKFCSETHIGPVGHGLATCVGAASDLRRSRHAWTDGDINDVIVDLETYHLYDRLGTIRHDDRLKADRIPALVELCIQAGVDLPEYPTLRRTRPVRLIGRRIVEQFDPRFELEEDVYFLSNYAPEIDDIDAHNDNDDNDNDDSEADNATISELEQTLSIPTCIDINTKMSSLSADEIAAVAETALTAWETMRNGVKKLMRRYPVRVCGYCPEVHVGPRGHKVRLCGAFKHQWRNGQHGWQEATIDDLIPPKYVWHVKDLQNPYLVNDLRKYYGKTPAVVELCVQAGAPVPEEFKPMMRLDVVVPDVDELAKVV